MIYESVSNNMSDLLREMSCITERQMCVFFEDVLEPINTKLYIGELITRGEIIKHDTVDCFVYRFGAHKKKDYLLHDIEAFWPIALWGSSQVRFVTQASYPSQLFVVSEDNRFFDFTVLDDLDLARFAAWQFHEQEYVKEKDIHGNVTPLSAEDIGDIRSQTTHIAVVKYENRVKPLLENYGTVFKTVCLVHDNDADVQYFVMKNGKVIEA